MNKLLEYLIDNFTDSEYFIGYRISSISFWDENISRFKVLPASFRYWYADPIPCIIENNIYIFFEQYDKLHGKGYIGVSKLKDNGKLSKPKIVLKEKTHLSFPMIIHFKGDYYMIPESSATKKIQIYKMRKTPYSWESYYSINIEEEMVDIVYLEMKGSFLLIGSILDEKNQLLTRRQIIQLENLEDSKNLQYRIGYTDETSSLMARNGGNIYFDDKNKRFRIAQESTETDYGMYLCLNEIQEVSLDIINEKLYKRKTIDDIEVNLNSSFNRMIGLHTYGRCENGFEVIDISVVKLSIFPLLRKLGIVKK